MAEISKEKIVKLAKEIADRLGQDCLIRADFVKETGISNDTIYKFFPDGGWAEVCRKAGLKTRGAGYPIEKGKLLEEFHRVVSEMGKIPNRNQLTPRSKYHEGTFRKRFGSQKNLKKEYCDWLITNVPESPLIKQLQTESKHDPSEEDSSKPIHQPIYDKTEFGAPMSFRGLTHAPITEQGVDSSRVRVLIREGRLPAQKVGRDWVILEPDLELVRVRKPGRPKNQKKQGLLCDSMKHPKKRQIGRQKRKSS